jgi:hypothetical protein
VKILGQRRLFFIQIFAGYVILRNFVGVDFLLVSVVGALNAGDYVRFKRVSFLQQLVDTLRIRRFDVGQSLQISGFLA